MLGVVLVPVRALAEAKITEIMYDAKGGDTGHEWIEITNLGGDPVALDHYKILESNTSHSVSLVTGEAVLSSGTSAVISPDPAVFMADHPDFTGNLCKASFSFSNTGETIKLKSASSTTIDSVTYSSSMGARGDGASLHRLASGVWQAGKPDPGVYTDSIIPMSPTTSSKTPPKTKNSTGVQDAHATTASAAHPADQSAAPATSSIQKTNRVVSAVAGAPTSKSSAGSLLDESLLGLVALILFGVASVWYTKSMADTLVEDTSPTPEEFDIEC